METTINETKTPLQRKKRAAGGGTTQTMFSVRIDNEWFEYISGESCRTGKSKGTVLNELLAEAINARLEPSEPTAWRKATNKLLHTKNELMDALLQLQDVIGLTDKMQTDGQKPDLQQLMDERP